MALLLTVIGAATAAAQTSAGQTGSAAAAGPVVNLWYAGVLTGTESVRNTGGVFGGEAGARVWRNLDLFLEGGSLADVVPQKQIDLAAPIVAFLQQTRSLAAGVNVKMPAAYWALGARWVFENVNLAGWARPYAQFAVGGSRAERQPTFTLGGADITSSLTQYGVTLGADLTAEEKGAAVSGGAGVLIPYRMVYGDVGFRITRLGTSGDAISATRLHVGVGVRF